MTEIDIGVDYKYNSEKTPNLKFYLLDSNGNIPAGDASYGINVDYNYELTINEELQEQFNSRILIDETIEEDYTLVVEHNNGIYPDDYVNGDFGIDITSLHIDGVDLTDLIHRKGVSYLDCTTNPYYTLEQINNNKFIANNFKLLNYRHNQIKGNNPRVFNNKTQETTEYNGYFVTECGYIIIDNTMYYDATNDINFIAENSDNENLFVKDDKLIHHIPNSSCLSLNGRWELKFKTPFYGWVVDNIFGND